MKGIWSEAMPNDAPTRREGMLDLATLTAVAQAATPGLRKYIGQDDDCKRVEIGKGRWECRWGNTTQVGADGVFIAACNPQMILALVARVRALEIVADTAPVPFFSFF